MPVGKVDPKPLSHYIVFVEMVFLKIMVNFISPPVRNTWLGPTMDSFLCTFLTILNS